MFFIVDTPGEKLTTKMLETKNVYILDCHSEIFVWYVKILSKILSLGFSFFFFFFFHAHLIPQRFREIFLCSIEQLEKRCEKLKICSVFLVKKLFWSMLNLHHLILNGGIIIHLIRKETLSSNFG